jgi:hypothetical protein
VREPNIGQKRPGMIYGSADAYFFNEERDPEEFDESIEEQPHWLRKRPKDLPKKSGVTLSGLLNAIDGAASPQGHVLIMTSNKPEVLDEALVRPGRVDMKIKFGKASKQQIFDLFLNLYTRRSKATKSTDADASKELNKATAPAESTNKDMSIDNDMKIDTTSSYDNDAVPALAATFSERVPAEKFTPAQLQQYILTHRLQPQEAVDQIETWVEEQLGDDVNDLPASGGLHYLSGISTDVLKVDNAGYQVDENTGYRIGGSSVDMEAAAYEAAILEKERLALREWNQIRGGVDGVELIENELIRPPRGDW